MKKSQLERIEKKLEIGVEEAIILFLITIEILDFFRIIPPALEFIEKTTAFIAFTYLFYRIGMTRILFGHKKKFWDALIVGSYLLLSLKTVMGFFISASEEQSILSGFYSFTISHIDLIEKVSFKAGVVLLASITLFLLNERIGRPSFMHIIHEERSASSIPEKMLRFVTIYLSLIAFFTVVFTFAIEWLATTVDAPVMVLVIILLLFIIRKHKKKMSSDSLLRRISEASEQFYERVIEMFQFKSRISIAIIGFLVLHTLVEIGHFIIPYTTGLAAPWYFAQLGRGHEPIMVPLIKDFALVSGGFQQLSVVLIYLISIIAVLMLFIAPAYLWYYLYKDKKIYPGHLTWIFFGAISVFLLAPVFRMKRLASGLLIGTDIITQQIPHLDNISYILLVGVLVAGIFMALNHRYPKRTAKVGFFVAIIYFAFYLLYFVLDIWSYYIKAIIILLQNSQYLISLHIFLFFIVTILFYTGGYVLLIYEVYAKQKI